MTISVNWEIPITGVAGNRNVRKNLDLLVAAITASSPVSGIGDPIASGTSGSVLYVDSSVHLAQNNSKLFWDATNNRLGIGTNSPSAILQVNVATATSIGAIFKTTDDSTTNKIVSFQTSAGTTVNSIGATGKTFWGNVDCGAFHNFYGASSGGALATFQHAAPNSGDVIFNAIHGGVVTGSLTVFRAAVNTTVEGTYQLIQSGAGNAGFQLSNFSTGDAKVIFDFNGSVPNFVLGVDQSDSGKFKIGTGSSLGSADKFTLDTSGNVSLTGNLTHADATNVVFNTTTGTKLGTATAQKLSFWNATPIIQPTTGVAAATLTSNGGTTLTDTDTFDGYTLKQLVKALRNTGLLA